MYIYMYIYIYIQTQMSSVSTFPLFLQNKWAAAGPNRQEDRANAGAGCTSRPLGLGFLAAGFTIGDLPWKKHGVKKEVTLW